MQFTSSNFVRILTTYAGSQAMQSAYQKQKGRDNVRSEAKPGQSSVFKKKKKKVQKAHCRRERKKSVDNKNNDSTEREAGMSLD